MTGRLELKVPLYETERSYLEKVSRTVDPVILIRLGHFGYPEAPVAVGDAVEVFGSDWHVEEIFDRILDGDVDTPKNWTARLRFVGPQKQAAKKIAADREAVKEQQDA